MSRLFWKIFLAFWAAMVIIAAIAAVATSQLAQIWQERSFERREQLGTLAEEAQQALTQGGAVGLEAWLRETVDREGGYVYVVGQNNLDLLGRKLRRLPERPPPGAFGPPRRGPEPHRPPPGGPRRRPPYPGAPPPGDGPPGADQGPLAVRWIYGPDGDRFTVIADVGLGPHDLLRSPEALGLRFLVALLVSGIVSFLLARYLTSPLLLLRRTTRSFTAGDLEARVGKALGARRDEIVDLGHDFDEMAERIGRMLTSQLRLLRDLSHELRSPLARLQVALELARKRAGDQAGAELQRIELEAERLNGLIGEILALARLESSPHELARHAVDLDELVGDVCSDADYEAQATGRRVRFQSSGAISYEGNDEMLRRAVENVVRNAARYTPEGSMVEVELERAADAAVIRVRDHGPGVPESALTRLFEPFYRDAEARGIDPGGHGIGLAIAKRAVEIHGGTITARNHRRSGLVVEIHLSPPSPA